MLDASRATALKELHMIRRSFSCLVLSIGLVACGQVEPRSNDGGPSSQPVSTSPAVETFDHAPFDKLLKEFVDDRGLVDYAGLKKRSDALDAYLRSRMPRLTRSPAMSIWHFSSTRTTPIR